MKRKIILTSIVFVVFFSFLTTGQTWDNFKRLTYADGSSFSPQIAVDSNNTVHVIWDDDLSKGRTWLLYKNGTNGGTGIWSAPKKLNWIRSVYGHTIAIDSEDTVHVIYGELFTDRVDLVHKASFDGGLTWTSPNRITWTSTYIYHPILVTSGTNNLRVFYADGPSLAANIYYKKRVAGTWFPPQQMTYTSGNSQKPYAALDHSNHLHLVYEEKTGVDFELYHKKTTDYGLNWSTRTRVTYSSSDSSSAKFDFTPANNIMRLIWKEGNLGSRWVNLKNRDPNTNTFFGLKRLNYNPGDCSDAAVAAPLFNHLHVVYSVYTGGDSELYHKKSVDGGATWTAPYRLTWNTGASRMPDMTYSGGPEYYYLRLVYSDYTPGNHEIYFRRGK